MALIKCPECGESVSDKAPNCPHCGLAIAGSIITCPECGAIVPKDAATCPKCAFPLHQAEVKEEKKAEPVVAPQNPVKEKEDELARIEPAYSNAKKLFESKSYVHAYEKINVALHASPNNADCLKLEEAIVDAIRETAYNAASELLQQKEFDKALTEVNTALQYAPNSQKLISLSAEIKSAKAKRKRNRAILITVIILAILAYVGYSIRDSYIKGHEEEAWTEAKDSATVTSLENFIEMYPDGKHSMEAQEMLEQIKKKDTDYWETIRLSSDADVFKQYKEKFPHGMYLSQADNKVDSLDWASAVQKNTPDAYAQYLSTHPNGMYTSDATSAQDKIKTAVASDEDIENMKNYFATYYSAVEEKDDESVLDFFEPVTSQYYGISNAKKSDITANLKKMHAKETSNPQIKVSDSNFKVTKDEKGNYRVTFSIDVTYNQEDGATATAPSKMLVSASVNSNKKITSITSRKQ